MEEESFEKESVDLLINKLWHSLVDKDANGIYAFEIMESQYIYRNIEALEKLYKIKDLLKNWYS